MVTDAGCPFTQEVDGTASNGDISMKGERSLDYVGDNVEYVVEQLDGKDPAFEAFSDIFAKFQTPTDYSEVRLSTPNPPKTLG